MPLEFGLVLQPGWRPLDPPDILTFNEEAIRRLSPAFTTLWTEDHFQKANNPALESWTTLTYMAARHERFRVGNLVLGQNYRNPAHLAKMAATLQYLSRGRLILGIGAGWQEDEYAAYGYSLPSAGTRIAQLGEAIDVLRAMWGEGPATYDGAHYHVENARCEPRPQPQPPIIVGGSGAKTIAVAARQADGWNSTAPIALFRERLAQLRTHLREAGRDADGFWFTLYCHLWLTEDIATFTTRQEELAQVDLLLLGPTPRAAFDQLRPYAELGVAHVAVKPYDLASIKRFTIEVATALMDSLAGSSTLSGKWSGTLTGDGVEKGRSINHELTAAEALVLFDLLSRWGDTNTSSVTLVDQAEWKVLWQILGTLEGALAEPFSHEYYELLERAREQVRDKWE